jgi:hypothetical protein
MARQPIPIPPPRPVPAAERARTAHGRLAQGWSDRSGRTASEQLGDVDFRLFLDPVLSRDPLGRMGYDPEAFRVYGPRDRADTAFFYFGDQDPDMRPDTVYVSPDFLSSPDVMAHEYRHRGVQKLHKEFLDNPKLFEDLFEPWVLESLRRYGDRIDYNRMSEEDVVEHFDDLDAVIPDSSRYPTMEATLDEALPRWVREFQNWTRDGVGYMARTHYPVQSGVMEAAQGVLRQRGEPPRAEFQEPGFMDRVMRGIGSLFGG